jgi:hypothetical protein
LEDAEQIEGPNLYVFNRNDSINRLDTDGRGSITSPAAQQVLYQELLETIASQMNMPLQQVIRRISLCASINATYKALNCKGCGFGCFTKSEAAARASCLASEVGLRATYLKLKCDYFLPGSITGPGGSAGAETGHKIQLVEKTAAMVKCTAKAAP